jgi:hypothetical protein
MVSFVQLRARHRVGEGNRPYHLPDEDSVYCEFYADDIGDFTLLYSDERGPVDNSDKHITVAFKFDRLSDEQQERVSAVCEWLIRNT